MGSALYLPLTKALESKPKKPKPIVGRWESGEWKPFTEKEVEGRKQITSSAQKSVSVFVPLRKADGGTMPPKPQPSPAQVTSAPPTAQPAGPKAPVANPEVRRMANDYVKQAGISRYQLPEQKYAPLLPEEHRKAVADAYDNA